MGKIALWCATALTLISAMACNAIEEELPSYTETSLVMEGDIAPYFCIESIDGERWSLSELRGETILLILFSHTCPDCKALFDELQQSIDSNITLPYVIAISRGGETQEIATYRTTNGYTIDMAADTEKEIYYRYATMYVPRCYLIDGDGIIQYMTYEYNEGDIARITDKFRDLQNDTQ